MHLVNLGLLKQPGNHENKSCSNLKILILLDDVMDVNFKHQCFTKKKSYDYLNSIDHLWYTPDLKSNAIFPMK